MKPNVKLAAVGVAVGAVLAALPLQAAGATPQAEATTVRSHVQLPAGMTAGVAVYDRATHTFTERSNATKQFRSASVVKLLIALDELWSLGPDYALPSADQAQLNIMLRSSDDAAASDFWARNGGGAIVERMVARLHLHDTAPPAGGRGWGFTAMTADDVVQIYRYVLDYAPAGLRNQIMGNLHQSTPCGTDGYDQSFGLPSAFKGRLAVKQGWSGYGAAPADPCSSSALTSTPDVNGGNAKNTVASAGDIDYISSALHTTGTVGAHDRVIVAVLSLHTPGTSFKQAAYDLTTVTRSLDVPSAVRAPAQPAPPHVDGYYFGTWSTDVPVRAEPNGTSTQTGTVPSGTEVRVTCQIHGEEQVFDGIVNDLWAYLPDLGGYMSNIFFEYPDNALPFVPDC
jgi:hypothetical protein